MNVFFVTYQEKDFAGHVGGSVWDGVYDSREKAQARVDDMATWRKVTTSCIGHWLNADSDNALSKLEFLQMGTN